MMQKSQDSRLAQVLQVIEVKKMRFPVKEIVDKTGFDKGYISAILKGKKVMSDNFYSTFMKSFPIGDQEIVKPSLTNDVFIDLLINMMSNTTKLVDSNKVLVDSNKILAETNASQTRMLEESKPTAGVQGEIPEAWLPKVTAVLGSIAKAGTSGWKSEQEALAELSKIVYGSSRKTPSKGIHAGSGK